MHHTIAIFYIARQHSEILCLNINKFNNYILFALKLLDLNVDIWVHILNHL